MSPTRGLFILGVCWAVAIAASRVVSAEPAKAAPPQEPPAQRAPAKVDQTAEQSRKKPPEQVPSGKVEAALQPKAEQTSKARADEARPPKVSSAARPTVQEPIAEPIVEAPSVSAILPPTAGLPQEPSIYETGRVGKIGVSDSGVRIKQTQDGAKPREVHIEEKAASPETPAFVSTLPGVLNAAVLGRELRPRFALLKDCRIEVARQRHANMASLAAGNLTLRWTILPSGRVIDTQVVATSPVESHIVDCVKRQMSFWSFSPPTGGPARVERPFKFQ